MATPSGSDVVGAHNAPGGTPGVEDTGGLNDVGAPGVQGAEENILSFVEQMENDSVDEGGSDTQPEAVVEQPAGGEPPVVEPVLVPGVKPVVAKQAVEPAPAAPAQAAVPAVVPSTPGAAAPQPGQAPAGEQAPPVVPAGQPAAPAAAQDDSPVDPFALAAETIRQHEAVFVEKLATDVYQIDQGEFDKVLGGDSKTLSLLCARVHANAVSSCMRTVAQTLPVYMDGLLQVRDKNRDREDRFWAANKHLDKATHKPYMKPIIQAARQLNPNADEATLDRLVGQMAAASFQIPMAQAPAAQPRVITPGPQVRQVTPAFQPAGVNGVGAGAQPNGGALPEGNVFTRMADILQAEDRGMFD